MRRYPKYVHAFIDKRRGRAKVRFYFRQGWRKQIPLPGIPGSVEFNEAYAAALNGAPPPVKLARAGTIGALVIAWFNSPGFLTLAPSTRRTYRLILENFTREHGDKPLAMLTRKHLDAMLAKRVGTPAAANHWLRLIKALMKFAVKQELRADDPSLMVDYLKRNVTGFHSWTEDEIATYRGHHSIGTRERLALELLLNMAARRSDVVGLGPQHVRNGELRFRPYKTRNSTGVELTIPILPELQAALDATPCQHLTYLTTQYGCPFTAAGFGGWFRERCDAAGLPKRCAAHGLRKACCRRLAEAGCSASVIAAISGHTTLREVERYVKAANQEKMARMGMAAIINGHSR